jgi:hypothetical protein
VLCAVSLSPPLFYTVTELNLFLISSGLIRLLLGRMAGLAEINNAWSMAQGAWSIETGIRDRSPQASASSSAASHCAVYNSTKVGGEKAKTFAGMEQRSRSGAGNVGADFIALRAVGVLF